MTGLWWGALYVVATMTSLGVGFVVGWCVRKRRADHGLDWLASHDVPYMVPPDVFFGTWPTLTNEDAMVEEVDEVVRRVAELERVRQEGEVDHGVSETEV